MVDESSDPICVCTGRVIELTGEAESDRSQVEFDSYVLAVWVSHDVNVAVSVMLVHQRRGNARLFQPPLGCSSTRVLLKSVTSPRGVPARFGVSGGKVALETNTTLRRD